MIKSLAMKMRSRLLQIYFSLLLAGTLLLSLQLLGRADGVGSGQILGYSLGRIALLIPVLILTSVIGWLTFKAWRDQNHLNSIEIGLVEYLEKEKFYISVILSGSILILFGAWIYQIGSLIIDPYFQGYFSKIAPFLLWGIFISSITLLFARLYRFGFDMNVFQPQITIIKSAIVIFFLLILLAFIMALTGLGLKPDLVGWGDPGTPVLPGQVLLLVALSVAALVVWESFGRGLAIPIKLRALRLIDVFIFVFFWILTIWIWQAQPLTPAYFAPEPVAPNFDYYPYSDAANYEVSAQELLIGEGFGGDVRRPMYSLFLAMAQYISGVGYRNILLWQIPLLALIPPLLYSLGKVLHSRIAGGLIAGLAIVHELNAIRLSSQVNVSHAKLLMSDLPTALGVIAFTVVMVYWWQSPQRRRSFPLLAGGILALTMLVRIQVFLLLPGVLIPVLIVFWDRKRQLAEASFLLLIGMGCVLIPWFWRGKHIGGNLSFAEAAQESQIGLIGVRYNLNPDLNLGAPLPGENSGQYSQRMLSNAVDFIGSYPINVLKFITTHLLHNQVSTLLTLPPTYASGVPVPYLETKLIRTWEQCCSVKAYIQNLPYWMNWDGQFPRDSLLTLLFNLLIISVGLGSTWRRQRVLGLLPVWFSLCYALGNSLVRNSGWRFNLPVDWVGLFYYGIGLVQITTWGAMFFTNRILPSRQEFEGEQYFQPSVSFSWKSTLILGVLFFGISITIPITESVIPPRYSDGWLDHVLTDSELSSQLSQLGINGSISDFAAQNNLDLLYGRALYPRYYGPKQGIPGNAWFAFVPRDYSRLGFFLIGSQARNVVLPLKDMPTYFPHAADVIVFGCSENEFLKAQMVIVVEGQKLIFQTDLQDSWGC